MKRKKSSNGNNPLFSKQRACASTIFKTGKNGRRHGIKKRKGKALGFGLDIRDSDIDIDFKSRVPGIVFLVYPLLAIGREIHCTVANGTNCIFVAHSRIFHDQVEKGVPIVIPPPKQVTGCCIRDIQKVPVITYKN